MSKSARSRSPYNAFPCLTWWNMFLNGRLTHITNNRINFAGEDKEKKGKKKEWKKKEEIYCILYVDLTLRIISTCTEGTLVLGTCYGGRNTVRTSCQRQVAAYGYTHTSYQGSLSQKSSRFDTRTRCRDAALLLESLHGFRWRVPVPLIRCLSSD